MKAENHSKFMSEIGEDSVLRNYVSYSSTLQHVAMTYGISLL